MIFISILVGLLLCCVIVIIKEISDPMYMDRFYVAWFSFLAAMMIICIMWVYSEVGFI